MLHKHAHLHLHRRADNPFISLLNDLNPFGNSKTTTASTSQATTDSDSGNDGFSTGDGSDSNTQGAQQVSVIVETVFSTSTPSAIQPSQFDDGGDDGGPIVTVTQTTTTRKSTKTSSSAHAATTHSTGLPKEVTSTKQTDLPTTLAVATNSPSVTGTDASAATSVSGDSGSSSSSSGGMSTGAKAGVAIGVLLAMLALFLAGYFFFSRRRKEAENERLDDDEKFNTGFASSSAAAANRKSLPRPPRLSLRPVTQLFPGLNTAPAQHPDRRASRGAMIAMTASPTQGYNRPAPPPNGSGSMWERPGTNASMNRDNPFGNHAERMQTPIAEESRMNGRVSPPNPAGPFEGAAAGAAVGAAAGAVAGQCLARKTSMRRDGPHPLDLTVQPPPMGGIPGSPAGTEFSVHEMSPGQAADASAGAAAIAAAGGPQHSAVHRVQLDFKPTLEDEMELRAGQLVRLLHEYDDGWALCIRLDRSEQGVVPRTCLSTRPVKPRPQKGAPRGPPVNPQRSPPGYGPNRGGPGPNYGPGGPNGPGGPGPGPQGRPMNPHGRPSGYPRPESPSRMGPPPGGRPMGPYGPQGRPQSPGPRFDQGGRQSPNGRRMSPPGPPGPNQQPRAGPPPRKPVPGQAY